MDIFLKSLPEDTFHQNEGATLKESERERERDGLQKTDVTTGNSKAGAISRITTEQLAQRSFSLEWEMTEFLTIDRAKSCI